MSVAEAVWMKKRDHYQSAQSPTDVEDDKTQDKMNQNDYELTVDCVRSTGVGTRHATSFIVVIVLVLYSNVYHTLYQ